jgi:hypothetical protein
MKLPRRKLVALVAGLSQRGREDLSSKQKLRNPPLGGLSSDVKVCSGLYLESPCCASMCLDPWCGPPTAAHPGSPAATKQVSFLDPLVSPLLQQEQLRICPGTIFLLPLREVFARPGLAAPTQPPQIQYPQRQRKLPVRIDL